MKKQKKNSRKNRLQFKQKIERYIAFLKRCRPREYAIRNYDLMDIMPPLVYNNEELAKKFAYFHSVTMTDDMLVFLNSITDKTTPIQEHIQIIGQAWWEKAKKMVDAGENVGHEMEFEAVLAFETGAMRKKFHSMSHGEPNFMGFTGKELCPCLSFAMLD